MASILCGVICGAAEGESSPLGLQEVADACTAAQHPLFLLLLLQLEQLKGRDALQLMFNKSKVNLLNLIPEKERNKEKLSDILEERGLSFLIPLLRIQTELKAGLEKDPSPHAFFKFIKDTV